MLTLTSSLKDMPISKKAALPLEIHVIAVSMLPALSEHLLLLPCDLRCVRFASNPRL